MCEYFKLKVDLTVPERDDHNCSDCPVSELCINRSPVSDAALEYFKKVVSDGEKFQASSVRVHS